MVFCRTRLEVDALTETLKAHGHRAEAVHGGLAQRERDRVMRLFRSGKADILVATDVAARGLDIERVSHVVNYDVPSAPEAYLHRIGRTGRVGRTGVAITLAEPREHRQLRNIEAFTKQKIESARVPSVADLKARRLDRTRGAVRERILAGELDDVRVVVESLAEEFDVMDVAAAAVKMVHAATGSQEGDEEEILEPPRPAFRPQGPGGKRPFGPTGRARSAPAGKSRSGEGVRPESLRGRRPHVTNAPILRLSDGRSRQCPKVSPVSSFFRGSPPDPRSPRKPGSSTARSPSTPGAPCRSTRSRARSRSSPGTRPGRKSARASSRTRPAATTRVRPSGSA